MHCRLVEFIFEFTTRLIPIPELRTGPPSRRKWQKTNKKEPSDPTEVSPGVHIDDAVILQGGKSRGDDLPCRSQRLVMFLPSDGLNVRGISSARAFAQ